jgi:putative transposase
MLRAYKFRLYPTKKQKEKLQYTLDLMRELYNLAIQERKDCYTLKVKNHPNYYDVETRKALNKQWSIDYRDQEAQLKAIKALEPKFNDVYSQILQDILRRVQKTYNAFYKRLQKGEKPGFPRYKGKKYFDSFTYPQSGFSLTHDKKVCLSKIGAIKIKQHRKIEGIIKTCTIKREMDKWFVIFSCEREEQIIQPHLFEEVVGIDLGLLHFGTFDDGRTIENPRYLRKAEAKLKKLQQAIAKKKKGSKRRKKAGALIGKTHRKIRNQRKDFLHKEARKLVKNYKVIVFEDLQIENLVKRPKIKQDENRKYLPNGASAKAGLNKSIQDAGWRTFIQYCEYKAENADSLVVKINPSGTSQTCSCCHHKNKTKLTLENRTFICEDCGVVLDRDENAAKNILRLGLSLQEVVDFLRSPCL